MDTDFIISLVAIVMALGIPIYAMKRHYNQTDDKLKIKQLDKEREIEMIKQENYLLENKQMQLELDKIKKEREEREQNDKNDRWLIKESNKKDIS